MSTIYWSVYPSAQADPSIADVINGTVANAAAQGSDTAPATTGNFLDQATGLSPSTSYKIAAVWSDGTSESGLSVSAAIVTAAASTFTASIQTSSASIAASLELERKVQPVGVEGSLASVSVDLSVGTDVDLTVGVQGGAASAQGSASVERKITLVAASGSLALVDVQLGLERKVTAPSVQGMAATTSGALTVERKAGGVVQASNATVTATVTTQAPGEVELGSLAFTAGRATMAAVLEVFRVVSSADVVAQAASTSGQLSVERKIFPVAVTAQDARVQANVFIGTFNPVADAYVHGNAYADKALMVT